MRKKYYLAADGGGSKLSALIYDEEFNVVSTAKTDGTNTVFKPRELVHTNIDNMLNELIPSSVTELEGADYCIVGNDGYFDKALKNRLPIKRMTQRLETSIGLAAGCVIDGILAISGTGSGVSYFQSNAPSFHAGGWGPLLGDEGSGYDIGLRTIKAAIYSSDCRRPPSILTEMIKDHFRVERLWDIIEILEREPDARHVIASVSRITSKAAEQGDVVAMDIYKHAAKELYRMTKAVIKSNNGIINQQIVLMGGAWKGSPIMFNTYRDLVKAKFPSAEFVRPDFEPVIGCIVMRLIDEGLKMTDIASLLSDKFSEFRINW